MSDEKPSWAARIGFTFLGAYLLMASLFYPYLSRQYDADHGFAERLILGQVVPVFQAMIWPYHLWNAL